MQKRCCNKVLHKSLLANAIREIGSFVFLLLFMPIVYGHSIEKIELLITDLDGCSVKTVGVGQVINLKVKITGDFECSSIIVPGITQFYYEPRGTYKTMYSINGVTTRTIEHNFILKPEKEGEFELGPLKLHNGTKNMISSNVIKLVVKKLHASKKDIGSDRAADIFLEVIPETYQMYVGQKINIAVRLYACKNIELLEIKLPDVDKSIHISQPQKAIEGKKVIGDKEYTFFEWDISLIADIPGQWPISQAYALCSVMKDDRFSHARRFGTTLVQFGFPDEHKRFYSDQFVLEVLSLPSSERVVDGIGSFDQFLAQTNRKSMRENDVVLLKITLAGTGNFEAIKKIDLRLSDGLRAYESKAETKENSKVFEYVIQGIKAGQHTIPSQSFYFFNPDLGVYSSLETEPITLTVEPKKEACLSKKKHQKSIDQAESVQEQHGSELSINEDGPWYITSSYSIPWKYFFMLCATGVLWMLVAVFSLRKKKFNLKDRNKLRKKNAFPFARKRLGSLEKNKCPEKMYDVFINLFADYGAMNPGEISEKTINTMLVDADISEETLQQWHRFFYEIASNSFAPMEQQEVAALFKRAHIWIEQLEQLL